MIIFIYGPDTYRSRQKLQEIIEHYKKTHKSGLSLKYFDAQSDNLEELLDWLKQIPILKEKKLVVLKNALKLAERLKLFAKSEDIILFFEEGKLSQKFQNAKAQKFEFLKGSELRNWIRKEFGKYGAKPKPDAIEKLIDCVGNDSWQLSSEILKLVNYKKSGEIQAKDVDILVRPKIETDIFKTIRALAFRDKKLALYLIHKHLEKGDNPLYLLAMISWQFRRLLTQGRNNLFTPQELKKIYNKIFEADLNIKTGKVEPQVALDLLITEI